MGFSRPVQPRELGAVLVRSGHPVLPCAPGAGALPRFLTAGRPDGWVEGDAPLEITNFDPEKDMLKLTFRGQGTMPKLALCRDEARGATLLKANGIPIAALRGRSPRNPLTQVAVAARNAPLSSAPQRPS